MCVESAPLVGLCPSDIEALVGSLNGPTVEVAGYTPEGYDIIGQRLTSPLLERYDFDVTSLPDEPGSVAMLLASALPKYRGRAETDNEHDLMMALAAYDEHYYAVRGTRCDFDRRSVHLDLAITAGRLLMPGGLLVWRDIPTSSALLATGAGLAPVAHTRHHDTMVSPFSGKERGPITLIDAVFQKAG